MAAGVTIRVSVHSAEALQRVEEICYRAALRTASAIEQDIKGAGPHAQDAARDADGRYVPSELGTPPRPRTGNLRRSFNIEPQPAQRRVLVGSDYRIAPYAPFVELGTSRMAARPALIPAAEYHGQTFAREIAAGMAAL